jgi:SAM-dependent methyltransferase
VCNETAVAFAAEAFHRIPLKGARVIEFGSFRSPFRGLLELHGVERYVGVDLKPGRGVDVTCRVEEAVERFGPESFNLVLSTEMVEHIRDWRRAFAAMKGVLRTGGDMILTTRSRGFPIHFDPGDYWRYETEDMSQIFSDFADVRIESDVKEPGVFVHAHGKQPRGAQLDSLALYSMMYGRRRISLTEAQDRALTPRWRRFRWRVIRRGLYLIWKLVPT